MSDHRITSHINCEKRIAELEATQQLCIVYKEKMLFESDVVALLEELEADLARHIATALDTNEALWKAEAENELLKTQIELVRQSFDTTYPGLGDPFKLRARYDEMTVELAALKWMLNCIRTSAGGESIVATAEFLWKERP